MLFFSNSVYRSRTERCVTRNCGDSNELRESAILPQFSPLSGDPRLYIHGVNTMIPRTNTLSWSAVHFMADFVQSELCFKKKWKLNFLLH